jgi:hypothetical protein
VLINCYTETINQRLVKEREKRPLISDVPAAELKSYIVKKYSSRKINYQQAAVILPEENLSVEKLVQEVFHAKA